MKLQKPTSHRIIIPPGAMIYPHEMSVATILSSWANCDVEFIPVRTTPTPDIRFLARNWEIKSPTGASSRTIENNLRNALKQSPNIVISLQRIKQPPEKCLREIKRQIKNLRGLKHLIVITKEESVIKII